MVGGGVDGWIQLRDVELRELLSSIGANAKNPPSESSVATTYATNLRLNLATPSEISLSAPFSTALRKEFRRWFCPTDSPFCKFQFGNTSVKNGHV
jgi:hypothetical protein